MSMQKLLLRPGVDVQKSRTLNEGGISTSQLIRFFEGLPQKLGGWQALPGVPPFIGTCRGLYGWADLDGNPYVAVGTEQRLQLVSSGQLFDITPYRLTTNNAPAFSTTSGSATVTIHDPTNGVSAGDWIYIGCPVSVGGLVLDGFYLVETVTDTDNYTITAAADAASTVASGGATPAFSTTSGSATVTVVLDNHGLSVGNLFAVSIATSVGGLTLSGSFNVTTVIDANTFTITASSNASSTQTVSENGGDANLNYLLPSGVSVNTYLGGYGEGDYGAGDWGIASGNFGVEYLRQWSLDHFGQDLIANPSGGGIYYWQPPTPSPAQELAVVLPTPAAPTLGQVAGGSIAATTYYAKVTYTDSSGETAASLESSLAVSANNLLTITSPPAVASATGWNAYVATATGAETKQNAAPIAIGAGWTEPTSGLITGAAPPTTNTTAGSPLYSLVTFVMSQVQIVIAAGAESDGTLYPTLVRWCDQGDFTDWAPKVTNQAGSFQIPTGSKIVAGLSIGLGALIWTDVDLWAVTYQGLPYVFGFNRVGTNCEAISMRAVAAVAGELIVWPSYQTFFSYNGSDVQPMACPVWDWFYGNYDSSQTDQIFSAVNSLFNEVAWYFPTTSGSIRYVKWNFLENLWDYGTLDRTAWIDHSPNGNPIGADSMGLLQQHEIGYNANNQPMAWSWGTGYFDIAGGEDFSFVDFVIPDFVGSYTAIQCTLLATNAPNETPTSYGPFTLTPTTNYINVRVRGRQMAVQFSGNDLGSFNRLGAIRYRMAPAGRR